VLYACEAKLSIGWTEKILSADGPALHVAAPRQVVQDLMFSFVLPLYRQFNMKSTPYQLSVAHIEPSLPPTIHAQTFVIEHSLNFQFSHDNTVFGKNSKMTIFIQMMQPPIV
jgi:hypothetical protein